MRTPTENGKRISKEDYAQMNDILRAAFYSVVNKDSYIGDSTKLEIDYATKLNKEIIFYE